MQKVNGRLTDYRALVCVLAGIWAGILFPSLGRTQTAVTNAKTEIYEPLKSFALTGGTSAAENLTLKRDRGVITFQSGTFYFSAPVEGQVRGAVFIGTGSFHADVPPSDFERENVNRLLKADVVESDFKTAVMRFTDDTFSVIGRGLRPGTTPPGAATKLAAEFERRFLKETGANVSARLAISIMDKESPGFFVAEFDKGKRGRFTFLMDQQCRIPVANFRINAGEKGLIFAFDDALDDNDVWIAFHGLEDYQHGRLPIPICTTSSKPRTTTFGWTFGNRKRLSD